MTNPRILIVEDEPIVALKLKRQIESYAIPQVVFTGMEAIAAAPEFHPDLVLMDICLEDEPGDPDGVETARQLQSQIDAPIVFVTAHDEAEIIERVKDVEPYGYLLKPVSERALRSTIQLALHRFQVDRTRIERMELLARTLRSIGDPLLVVDAEGAASFCNVEATRLLGIQDESHHGMLLNDILQIENPGGAGLDLRHLVLDHRTIYRGRVGVMLRRRDGTAIPIHICGAPVTDSESRLMGAVFVLHDTSRSEEVRGKLEQTVLGLQQKLSGLKAISSRLPICPHCKKVRDEHGVWYPVEQYLRLHTDTEFTHGPCPDCAEAYREA
jgi:PAS domain S-box-containing protein